MKLNVTEELRKESLLSHIILHGLTVAITEGFSERMKPFQTKEGIILDVKLTAGGVELDINEFCEHWQSQVSRMIDKGAQGILSDKFSDISDLLIELEERLKPELNSRVEDWETR
jgi:hypothetical protein